MKQIQPQPVWVSEAEAARILQLSQGTLRVWRYIEKKKSLPQRVPWRKWGASVRYYLPALLEFKPEFGHDDRT